MTFVHFQRLISAVYDNKQHDTTTEKKLSMNDHYEHLQINFLNVYCEFLIHLLNNLLVLKPNNVCLVYLCDMYWGEQWTIFHFTVWYLQYTAVLWWHYTYIVNHHCIREKACPLETPSSIRMRNSGHGLRNLHIRSQLGHCSYQSLVFFLQFHVVFIKPITFLEGRRYGYNLLLNSLKIKAKTYNQKVKMSLMDIHF